MVGVVVSGSSTHHKIMPKHNTIFKKTIGFIPYPGTLNVRLNERLQLSEPIVVKDLMWLYPIKVNNIKCYAIRRSRAYRNNQTRILGVVAPYCLRDRFNLKDGDTVDVEVVKE